MATVYNDFSELAQAVWVAVDRSEKVELINIMITNCISNDVKKATFRRQVLQMNVSKLDRFAADLMLCDHDKVIKVA